MDYTYNELMAMQQDAIKRVEQMQERARKTAGLVDENKEKPKTEHKNNKEEFSTGEPKRIHMPGGYLKDARSRNLLNQGKNEKESPQYSGGILDKIKSSFDSLNIEKDKALLLSLIMLLSEEESDETLIMALIYMLT